MPNTTARIKRMGKTFEILVDMDAALKFKKGAAAFIQPESDRVFSDVKKGLAVPNSEIMAAFGTLDIAEIAKKIVKDGEVLVSQEHRDEERENKIKQVVNFLATNAVDAQSGRPFTPEKIKSALEQAHVNIKNAPVDSQIKEIISQIAGILPIKLETKRLKITIPAVSTGKAYGIVSQYKEDEKWLGNGDLEVKINIPSGIVMDFYDKLNSITHGSAIAEEIKE